MTEIQPATLFAVRHGETEWNLIGRHQGHMDSPLTGKGIQQARALAEALVGRGIEFIYSSDLARASKTAGLIGSRLNLPINTDQRLRERHLGTLQGLTKKEFRHRYCEEWTGFASGDPHYCLPGGESAQQHYIRAVACIQELAERHKGRTILAVTHGGVLNWLFYRSIGIPISMPRRCSIFNAAINCFTINGRSWRIDTWGETSHL